MKSEELLGIKFDKLGTESQLRFMFIVMKEYPKTAILVQGYTDSSGSEQYNMELSQRRANAVSNHLALNEVGQDRMSAIGYGEGYPVADNSTPAGRTLNRRVSILVKGKA